MAAKQKMMVFLHPHHTNLTKKLVAIAENQWLDQYYQILILKIIMARENLSSKQSGVRVDSNAMISCMISSTQVC